MNKQFEKITTTQLSSLLSNPKVKIIDIRSIDAYNGWRVQNEIRGGHIKTAKSLPFKWVDYFDWLDIVNSKNIPLDSTLIIYGYDKNESQKVACQFHRTGYHHIFLYNEFVNEWCADSNLPISQMEKYMHLVSAQWLNDLINKGDAPELDNKKFVICHAHYRNRSAYDEGHIPGAIEIDTNSLESPDTWNCRSPQELKSALELAGITFDTTVILYGRYSFPNNSDPFPGSSAGDIGAMRCAFIMLYAGVKDIRILNGGLQSWIDSGYQVSKEYVFKSPVSNFGVSIPQNPELIVDIAEAKQMLQAPDKNLVCVRSWREYIGEVSGYNYIHKKGRIPGAVFANCGSDAYHMENYRNVDHTTREYHEIEKLWEDVHITPDKHNAFYCGTGWRASEAFINAWLLGWPRISVFDGGWFEWSNDDNNPYETGVP